MTVNAEKYVLEDGTEKDVADDACLGADGESSADACGRNRTEQTPRQRVGIRNDSAVGRNDQIY